jgi:hypothetical protein
MRDRVPPLTPTPHFLQIDTVHACGEIAAATLDRQHFGRLWRVQKDVCIGLFKLAQLRQTCGNLGQQCPVPVHTKVHERSHFPNTGLGQPHEFATFAVMMLE